MGIEFISLIIGLLSLILSLIFYFKSKVEKEPCWAIKSINLIRDFSSKINDLKIVFREKQIENLSLSKILFWNKGKKTIDNDDIDTINCIRIVCENKITILDAKIIQYNNNSNQCRLIKSDKGDFVKIQFDYLDSNHGFVSQIIHTGTSSDNLSIIGDVKGVKQIKKISEIPFWVIKTNNFLFENSFFDIFRYVFYRFTFIYGLFCFTMVLLSIVYKIGLFNFPSINSKLLKIFQSSIDEQIFVLCSGIFLILYSSSKIFKRNVPKGLESFLEEDNF